MTAAKGLDVSNYTTSIDWAKAKRDGYTFAYALVGQGNGYRNPRFQAQRLGARQAGIAFGGYWFCDAKASGEQNATDFWTAYQPQPGELYGVLDAETPLVEAESWIGSCVGEYAKLAGHYPTLYMPYAAVEALHASPTGFLRECPLWIPYWDATLPPPPAPWRAIAAQQTHGGGTVPGVVGAVDLDAAYDLRVLQVPKPAMKPVTAREWLWAQWWLGIAAFTKAGPHNRNARPASLPRVVPPTWWPGCIRAVKWYLGHA